MSNQRVLILPQWGDVWVLRLGKISDFLLPFRRSNYRYC